MKDAAAHLLWDPWLSQQKANVTLVWEHIRSACCKLYINVLPSEEFNAIFWVWCVLFSLCCPCSVFFSCCADVWHTASSSCLSWGFLFFLPSIPTHFHRFHFPLPLPLSPPLAPVHNHYHHILLEVLKRHISLAPSAFKPLLCPHQKMYQQCIFKDSAHKRQR